MSDLKPLFKMAVLAGVQVAARLHIRRGDDVNSTDEKGRTPLMLAMNLYNIFAKSEQHPFVVGISQGGCRPYDNNPSCHYEASEAFLKVYHEGVRAILYHQSGSYLIMDGDGNVDSNAAFDRQIYSFKFDDIEKIKLYLERLSAQFNVDTVWIGPFSEYRYTPLSAVFRNDYLDINPNSPWIFAELDAVLSGRMSRTGSVSYVPFRDLAAVPDKAFVGECFVFRDTDHFSRCGEALLGSSVGVKNYLRHLGQATH